MILAGGVHAVTFVPTSPFRTFTSSGESGAHFRKFVKAIHWVVVPFGGVIETIFSNRAFSCIFVHGLIGRIFKERASDWLSAEPKALIGYGGVAQKGSVWRNLLGITALG